MAVQRWGIVAIAVCLLVVGLYIGHRQYLPAPPSPAPEPASAYTVGALIAETDFTRLMAMNSITSVIGFLGGTRLAAGSDGVLWLTSGANNRPLSYIDAGGVLHSPALRGTRRQDLGGLSVGPDQTVWAMAGQDAIVHVRQSGQATEYDVPNPNASICDLTAGAGGTAWFLQADHACTKAYEQPTGRNWIGHIDRNGRIALFALPKGHYLCQQISAGGALWFFERQGTCGLVLFTPAASWIGQIAADGRVTRYKVPALTAQSMVAAPDGSVWLSDEQGKHFWHLAGGRITQYPLPSNDDYDTYSNLAGLTPGPDGNLWFLIPGFFKSSYIGRITPRGAITTYRLSGNLSGYEQLFSGRHGDLWFQEYEGAVGHITTSGAVTEYPIPDLKAALDASSSAANGDQWLSATFTVGPDGSAWFGADGLNWLGQITPRGEVKEYRFLPPKVTPSSLAFDAAGNVWLYDGLGNIARITLPGRVSAYRVSEASGGFGATATGRDGALWFLDAAGNAVGRRSASGALKRFTVPTAQSGLRGLAAGAAGSLWFTEYDANRIGRIDAHGAVVEYPLPQAISRPTGIALGPDGDLWFTESGTNRIGRITPGGRITEFPTSIAGGQPVDITAGPDGALWFTDDLGGYIGRITVGARVSTFRARGSPNHIASGPDGALWFTDYAANSIGRITAAGAIRKYVLPTANSYPNSITAGPDGALWFTERATGAVGRISTNGVIREYPLAHFSQAEGIAASGGALWLTEGSGNWLARIAP